MQIDKVSTQVTKQKRQYNAEKKVHTTDDNFAIANMIYCKSALDVFRFNVKSAILSAGSSVNSFFKQLNATGLKIDRCNFISGNLRFFPSILWVGTFARCLGLQTHQLLDPSLPDKLASGEVVVKIQFLPPKDGDK